MSRPDLLVPTRRLRHYLLTSPLAFLLLVFPGHRILGAKPAPKPVPVAVDESIQSLVDRNPRGTTFLIKAGIHRLQSVVPKDGDSFLGETGAVLNGALLLSSFQRQGQYWVASASAEVSQPAGKCASDSPVCWLPEDLFVDDVPLRHQARLAEVGPGKWFMDYAGGKVYLADNPEGHKVELSQARHALSGSADNVTIHGLVIEKYATPVGHGAIYGGDPSFSQGGGLNRHWIVELNEIRYNHSVGVRTGNEMQVLRNKLHHNGEYGVGGSGRNILVDGNEIAYNNYAGYDFHWGAGGTKFAVTDGAVVRNNYVHDNEGPGLWSDIENRNILYEHNHTKGNRGPGIFHEISLDAVIRDNIVEEDNLDPSGKEGIWEGAGILISASSNVDVYGNRVTDCLNGIIGIQADRGNSKHGATPYQYRLQNLKVHNNVIIQKNGFAAGIVSNPLFAPTLFTDWNNRFEDNTYQLANSTHQYYYWMNSPRTRSEWQAFGNDRNGKWTDINASVSAVLDLFR